MKLKYYLRGLGIGIIITTLIMHLTSGGSDRMTDAEIKRRAAELGMVEEEDMTLLENAARAEMEQDRGRDVSANKASQNSVSQNGAMADKVSQNHTPQKTVSSDGISGNSASGNSAAGINAKMPEIGSALDEAEDGQADRSGRTETKSANEVSNEADAESARRSAAKSGSNETDEYVTITIHSGQSSILAANACFNAGLVEDAAEFDTFLCNDGYDRMLKAGSYQIKKGASAEEIARALTGRN